jgi:two-component sensor histidine kinase
LISPVSKRVVTRLSNPSLRTWLTLFALGLIVPTAVVAALLIGWNVMEARRSAEFALLADARAMSAAIDQDVARHLAFAQAIASSDALGRRDWTGVRARIDRLALGPQAWVAIGDRGTPRLLNTAPGLQTFASETAGHTPGAERTLESGKPRVSNLFTDPATRRAVVAIDSPAIGAPELMVVSLVLDPDRFGDIMRAQPLPRRGFATLVGSDHRVIMRTRDVRKFQGAHATPSMVRALQTHQAGIISSRSLDGVRTVVAYAPSSLSGWTVMVVVPRAEFEAPIWRMAAIVLAVFLSLLLLSLQIARYASRRIAAEISALERDALTLSAGQIVAHRTASIANIDRVQSALSHASVELHTRAERQVLLINELNHRVKNTLATVQALAVQTFRGSDPDRARAFEQRLVALGAAHDLLTRSVWSAVDIQDVTGRCGEQLDGRVVSRGPSLLLPPEAALALCMILHELQTNSLKYGSLSAPDGRVEVNWDEDDEVIAFQWIESGGPPVTAVVRKGFGTRLIDRLVRSELNGEVERDFRTSGLVVTGRFRPPPGGRWGLPGSAGDAEPR